MFIFVGIEKLFYTTVQIHSFNGCFHIKHQVINIVYLEDNTNIYLNSMSRYLQLN